VLARDLIGERRAVWPAVLSLAGTWMLASAMTVTEVLAFPLTTAALCTTVIALRRRDGRLGLLALGFAVLAAAARLQLVVIVFVVVGAFVVDVLRCAGQRRAMVRAYRAVLVAGGVAGLAIAVGAVAAHGLAGDYSEVYGFRPSLAAAARKSGLQFLELVVSGGLAPVLLAVAGGVSVRAWRDDRARPLLIVFWLATVALVVQGGWYLAGIPAIPTGIERYVFYVAPLAFVLLGVLAVKPRLLARGALAVAALVSLGLLAMPANALNVIEPATWATGHRIGGLTGLGQAPALALAGLLSVGAAALAIRRRHALPALFAVALVALGVQSQAGWNRAIHETRSDRRVFGDDLRWIDHHTPAPAALLQVAGETEGLKAIELFNRNIVATLQPAGAAGGTPRIGEACRFGVGPTGVLVAECAAGRIQPRTFVITDPLTRVTMYDETSRASNPDIGQTLQVAPGRPARVRSFVVAPCPRSLGPPPSVPVAAGGSPVACGRYLTMHLWLDRPGSIALRFRGGDGTQTVRDASNAWVLPAHRLTTLRLPVARGASRIALAVDWQAPAGAPRLVAATLRQQAQTTPLL
jgi:hypothetical protein